MASVCAIEFLPISYVRVCACAFLIFDKADDDLEDGLFWGADQAEIQRDPERFSGPLHHQILSANQLLGRMQRA